MSRALQALTGHRQILRLLSGTRCPQRSLGSGSFARCSVSQPKCLQQSAKVVSSTEFSVVFPHSKVAHSPGVSDRSLVLAPSHTISVMAIVIEAKRALLHLTSSLSHFNFTCAGGGCLESTPPPAQ